MLVALIIVFAALVAITIVAWRKRKSIERELERYSVSPQELHTFIASGQKLAIFDVRQALDLLAYPEKIPGAERVPPEEVLAKPDIIPRDQDVVVYCTCPSEKTSRRVLGRTLRLGFSRVRFLAGGLAAWKTMGFPVEPYRGSLAFSSPGSAARRA